MRRIVLVSVVLASAIGACGKKDDAKPASKATTKADAGAGALGPIEDRSAAQTLVWMPVPSFHVQVWVPGDCKVEDDAQKSNAFIGNGTFKLNLFRVDQYSLPDAQKAHASLMSEPGFQAFTKDEPGKDGGWHYEYTMTDPKTGAAHAGVSARLVIDGKKIDCGVHNQPPELAAAAAAACTNLKPL